MNSLDPPPEPLRPIEPEMARAYHDLLYTPVVCDVLDSLGRYHQFLPSSVHPMLPTMTVFGRAMPVRMIDVYGEQPRPFGKLTEALDQLQPGEVYMGSLPSGLCACWGEMLTATARVRRAAGAVVFGPHRDTLKVLEQNWPVFSTGSFAQDSRVRMAVEAYRVPIEIEGTLVRPGDLVFGDRDGVVIIPYEVEQEVFEKSVAKASAENLVRKEIEQGLSSTEALKKYGVL